MIIMIKIINISSFSRSKINQDPIAGSFYGWHSRFSRKIAKTLPYKIESWCIDASVKKKLQYRKGSVLYRIFPSQFYISPGREVSIDLLRELARQTRHHKVIIHLHDFHNWQTYAIGFIFRNERLVAHFHGTTTRPIEKIKNFKKIIFLPLFLVEEAIERFVLPNVNHFFLANTLDQEYYQKNNMSYSFCAMAPDLETFQPMDKREAKNILGISQDQHIMLNVGGFTQHKNLELTVLSFAELLPYTKATLIIIGPSYDLRYRSKVLTLINQLNIVDRVRVIDKRIQKKYLNIYFNAADVLVVTAIEEGGPTVTLEALACGTPVVSTLVGLAADIYSQAKGLLFIADANPSSFGQIIRKVFSLSEKKVLPEAITPWTWEGVMDTIKIVYRKLLFS